MLTIDRLPGETPAAYRALESFLTMGPARTLHALAATTGKSQAMLAKWSKAWKWTERAVSFDTGQKPAPADREAAVRDKLLAKADDMLAFPLADVTRVTQQDMAGNEKQVTTVHPAGWNMNTALRFLTTARALAKEPAVKVRPVRMLVPRRHTETGLKIE